MVESVWEQYVSNEKRATVSGLCLALLITGCNEQLLETVHTVVNLYLQNNEYDGVFRWGTVYDTSLNGGNIE